MTANGGREGADEILFAECVDSVFHAHTRVRLAQRGRGNTNESNAAMRRRRSQPNHIQQCAAAHANDVRMAVHVMPINPGVNFRNVKVGILGPLAAFDDQRRTNKLYRIGLPFKKCGNLPGQVWLRFCQRFVEHNQHFLNRCRPAAIQYVPQDHIRGVENALSEVHSQLIAHLDGSLDDRHLWPIGRRQVRAAMRRESGSPSAACARSFPTKCRRR